MTARFRRGGFTLIEVLLVMAILAVVMGVLGLLLVRSLRQTQLREAASQVAGDLRRVRADAQKTGQVSTLTLAAAGSRYTMQAGSTAARVVEVPNQVTVTPVSGEPRITYRPPFGTLGAEGAVWAVQSPAAADLRLYVKIVGITGKVMISGTAD
ncbi:type II secretion system protein [uncultured Deinococcus sp.]|uniref:pilus assembly FimT family protein n=1 Tax=uncultured Deinococcus sp. TaxID=158789 RepID=UPI0025FC07D3|nr:type II secretion system protein [uncultured Deinococcus sp.]